MSRVTKPDKTGHVEQVVRELTPEQVIALGALLQGQSDGEAADLAGVSRQTVNGWRNHDAVFVANLNAERSRLWLSHVDRLRGLVANAVDVLSECLQDDDARVRQATAVHILRAVGLYGGSLAPSGPTAADDVLRSWERAANLKALDMWP